MITKCVNIAIVEDNLDVIEFLKQSFEAFEEFSCEYIYGKAEEAIAHLPKTNVDVVIVDIKLPEIKGIECVREVKALRPDMLFLMYTTFDENDDIFESLKAGASGYLLKTSEETEIVDAVRELLLGGSPMTPSIARKVTEYFFDRTKSTLPDLDLLSPRENEVLKHLSKGLLYKEIAEELNIKTGTVKQHIHNIYKKMHVQNRTEAINQYLGRTQKGIGLKRN